MRFVQYLIEASNNANVYNQFAQDFQRDTWQRAEGGGGVSRLIEEGDFFERGGVNFSHVTGQSLPASATAAPFTDASAKAGGRPVVSAQTSVCVLPG